MSAKAYAIVPLIPSRHIDRLDETIRPLHELNTARLSDTFARLQELNTARLSDTFARLQELNSTRLFDSVRRVNGLNATRVADLMGQFSQAASAIDSARLVSSYAASMPAAVKTAEAFVVEEVLPEVTRVRLRRRLTPTTRLRQLTPDERRRARDQVEKAIYAVLTIAGIASGQKAVALIGPCLALASALLGMWAMLTAGEDEG